VLPYCRFFWPDLLEIAGALEDVSAYHIAQYRWVTVSFRTILRLRGWLKSLHEWLARRCREEQCTTTGSIATLGERLLQRFDWHDFSRMLLHHLFAARTVHMPAQHKVRIKRL
jgi:hypothetical protein